MLQLLDDKIPKPVSPNGGSTTPTIGFNFAQVSLDNTRFNAWDIGGRDHIRPLWRHYFPGTLLPKTARYNGVTNFLHDRLYSVTPQNRY